METGKKEVKWTAERRARPRIYQNTLIIIFLLSLTPPTFMKLRRIRAGLLHPRGTIDRRAPCSRHAHAEQLRAGSGARILCCSDSVSARVYRLLHACLHGPEGTWLRLFCLCPVFVGFIHFLSTNSSFFWEFKKRKKFDSHLVASSLPPSFPSSARSPPFSCTASPG